MAQPPTGARSLASLPAETGPLYRAIVHALKGEILQGRFAVGDLLPTEGELRERFGVSRHTIREALRQLRADGLVESRQGAGTRVLRPGGPSLYVHTVASVDELTQYANDTRYEIDNVARIVADQATAERLERPLGEAWLRVRGFRYSADMAEPICWTEVFINADFAGIERLLPRATGPIYALIEDLYGESIAKVDQILRARPVPTQPAERLGVEPASAGVEIRRNYFRADNMLIEAAFNLYPADRFSYSMTLHRNPTPR
jgi:GntR family transcriptional regulator